MLTFDLKKLYLEFRLLANPLQLDIWLVSSRDFEDSLFLNLSPFSSITSIFGGDAGKENLWSGGGDNEARLGVIGPDFMEPESKSTRY